MKNSFKNINIDLKNNNILMWKLLSGAGIAICAFFKKEEPLVSEDGNKVLSDSDAKKKLFEALKNGDEKIETEYGTFHIQ
jgi:hypothetical protein